MKLYDTNGNPLSYSSMNEAESLLRSGKAVTETGNKINLVDPEGNIFPVESDNINEYLKNSYSISEDQPVDANIDEMTDPLNPDQGIVLEPKEKLIPSMGLQGRDESGLFANILKERAKKSFYDQIGMTYNTVKGATGGAIDLIIPDRLKTELDKTNENLSTAEKILTGGTGFAIGTTLGGKALGSIASLGKSGASLGSISTNLAKLAPVAIPTGVVKVGQAVGSLTRSLVSKIPVLKNIAPQIAGTAEIATGAGALTAADNIIDIIREDKELSAETILKDVPNDALVGGLTFGVLPSAIFGGIKAAKDYTPIIKDFFKYSNEKLSEIARRVDRNVLKQMGAKKPWFNKYEKKEILKKGGAEKGEQVIEETANLARAILHPEDEVSSSTGMNRTGALNAFADGERIPYPEEATKAGDSSDYLNALQSAENFAENKRSEIFENLDRLFWRATLTGSLPKESAMTIDTIISDLDSFIKSEIEPTYLWGEKPKGFRKKVEGSLPQEVKLKLRKDVEELRQRLINKYSGDIETDTTPYIKAKPESSIKINTKGVKAIGEGADYTPIDYVDKKENIRYTPISILEKAGKSQATKILHPKDFLEIRKNFDNLVYNEKDFGKFEKDMQRFRYKIEGRLEQTMQGLEKLIEAAPTTKPKRGRPRKVIPQTETLWDNETIRSFNPQIYDDYLKTSKVFRSAIKLKAALADLAATEKANLKFSLTDNIALWEILSATGSGIVGGLTHGEVGAVAGALIGGGSAVTAKRYLAKYGLNPTTYYADRIARGNYKNLQMIGKATDDLFNASKKIGVKTFSNLPKEMNDYFRDDKDYEKRYEEIMKYGDNPELTDSQFRQNNSFIQTLSPEIANETLARLQSGYALMAAKVPRKQDKIENSNLNRDQKYKIKEYYATFENPQYFFDKVAKGHISPEGLEMLKVAYPNMYQAFEESVYEVLSDENADKLPNQLKQQLQKSFGIKFRSYDFMLLQQNFANQDKQTNIKSSPIVNKSPNRSMTEFQRNMDSTV